MTRLLAIALILASLATSAAGAQGELQDERILLTFIPNIQFSPFYVGIQDGHFAEHGFNVTLEHLQEPEVLDLVAAGHADFGIVSGEQVILARAQARDVVYVFEWFQQYPVGLVVAGDLTAPGLESIRGTKVGIPGRFGASYSGLTTLLHSAGLTEDDIQIEEIGFNAPDVFCAGVLDAAVVYINNEPLEIWRRFKAGECGNHDTIAVYAVALEVDLVSNGLIVSADLLERDPDKVSRMVTALGQSLKSTIDNPAQAYLSSISFVENLPADADLVAELEMRADEQRQFLESDPSREQIADSRAEMGGWLVEDSADERYAQLDVLLRTIDLWDAEVLGYSELGSWESMRTTLDLMGFLDGQDLDLTAAFTNQFIAGSGE